MKLKRMLAGLLAASITLTTIATSFVAGAENAGVSGIAQTVQSGIAQDENKPINNNNSIETAPVPNTEIMRPASLSTPVIKNPVYISTASGDLVYGDETVTRAEWLHDLAVVFDMSVDEMLMPDNYFNDLENSHKYYSDILLTVEFGVVDIEAGQNLYPDDPATREFAATTLNFCLGYQLDEEEYIFSDISEVSSPVDAQVAINNGWLALIDGKFLPDRAITPDEVQGMMDYASLVVDSTIVDDNYDSVYEFQSDVIIVPDGTEVSGEFAVEEGDTNIINIVDCPVTIQTGDKFAVYFNEIPVVYSALKVTKSGNITTISADNVSTEDAFVYISAQGSVGSDSMTFTPVEDADVEVYNDDTGELVNSYKAYANVSQSVIPASNAKAKASLLGSNSSISVTQTLKVDSAKLTVKAKIKNPEIEYSAGLDWMDAHAYATLIADVEYEFSITTDAGALTGTKTSVDFGTFGVPGVGGITLSLEVDLSGKASGTVKGTLCTGIQWTLKTGLRTIRSFSKTDCYTSIEASASASLVFKFGITQLPIINAYAYAKIGLKADFKGVTYSDNVSPHMCSDFSFYITASIGFTIKIDIKVWSNKWDFNYDIINKSNSPIRVQHHYEDGLEVAKCTRGSTSGSDSSGDTSSGGSSSGGASSSRSGYVTKGTSRWSGSGWSGANRAYSINDDGTPMQLYDYTVDGENATITKYKGYSNFVNIPDTIDGYTVTAIGESAFEDNTRLAMVVIPSTVKEIGSSAFYNCTSLSSVNIPDGVKEIKRSTFENCYNLSSITIPDSVTEIQSFAFANCTSVSNLVLSKNLTYINHGAFMNCTKLSSVLIPKSLESADVYSDLWGTLYYGVFEGTNLTSVTFETGIKKIPDWLFFNCDKLPQITVPSSVVSIGRGAFYACVGLEEVSLSDNLVTIESSAFEDCASLTKIVIPDSVTEIGSVAFRNCSSLEDVKLPKNLTFIDYGAFMNCEKLKKIIIPKALERASYNDNVWGDRFDGVFENSGLKNVEFETGMTRVPAWLFFNCSSLESITIPETVVTIDTGAFYNCTGLKNVSISENILEIHNLAFLGCTSLTEIEIPDSVVSIDGYAFSDCVSLSNVKLSNHLTYLGYGVFENCENLTKIFIPKSLEETDANSSIFGGYYGGVFNGSGLKDVEFEKGVTSIPEWLFFDCDSLETIIIPDTVRSIGYSAFRGADGLKTIVLPSGLEDIDSYAFFECTSLEEITIPEKIHILNQYVFYGCTSLAKIVIPDSVTRIGNSVFEN
ncbi:MAG: leucine-rich repeat domain-containing protein [Eubacterium sp.]|nr:leucine-rich repeat domain-containing protein [Eubacterium sp.]